MYYLFIYLFIIIMTLYYYYHYYYHHYYIYCYHVKHHTSFEVGNGTPVADSTGAQSPRQRLRLTIIINRLQADYIICGLILQWFRPLGRYT